MHPPTPDSRLESNRTVLRRAGPVLVACCVAFLMYASSLRFWFVYDDRLQVLNNPWLHSWRYVPQYFTHNVWHFVAGATASRYWRPLFLLWLRANYAWFSLDASGWHFTTVMLHVGVTALVYALARRLTGEQHIAFGAACIFAVHPVLIETVAWISGATDSLMAIALLSSLLLYLKMAQASKRRGLRVWAPLTCYGLALLCKETAVVAPILILLLEFSYTGDIAMSTRSRIRAAVYAMLPYLGVTVGYFLVRFAVFHSVHGNPTVSYRAMALTAPSLLLSYLRLLAFPLALSPCYDTKIFSSFSVAGVVFPVLILGVFAAGLWFLLRLLAPRYALSNSRQIGWEAALFGIALLFVPLLPALYIRELPPYDFAHTRYLYVPCIGWSLLLAMGISRLSIGRAMLGIPSSRWVALLAIVAALSFANFRQQSYWSDGRTLFEHAIKIAPKNPVARSGLAVELADEGFKRDALRLFSEVAAGHPEYWDAFRSAGGVSLIMGNFDEAERFLQHAVSVAPERAESHELLAEAQLNLGKLDEAQRSIDQALRLFPEGKGYHYMLGAVLRARGDRQGAIRAFQTELALNPENERSQEQLRDLLHAATTP